MNVKPISFSGLRTVMLLALTLSFLSLPASAAAGEHSTGPQVHRYVIDLPAAPETPAPRPAPRHWLPLAGLFSLLGLGASVVITQLQPTNQIPTHDSYFATVTMAAGDGTATIPHGLGVTPLEFTYVFTAQGSAGPASTAAMTAGSTNLVFTKSTSANMDCSLQVWAKKPHTLGE